MPDGGPTPTPSSAEAMRAAFEYSNVGLCVFDAASRISAVNQKMLDLLGCPAPVPRELPGLFDASAALDPAAAALLLAATSAALDGAAEVAPAIFSPGGGARSLSLSINPIESGRWLAVLEDITLYRDAATRAIEGLMRDALTGLGNRQLFAERAGAALAAAEAGGAPCALMLIDLDRFKAVNDTLGHPTGDALLCLVAERLRAMVRGQDLIARLGGDEFALLLRSPADEPCLAALADRVVSLLGRPYLIEGQLVNIGASAGVAVGPRDGQTYDAMLKSADLALYHAKASGRGTHAFFAPDMDLRAHERRALELDFRRALALGELELHFQPQLDLATGRLEAFEALSRWAHPERGMVPPLTFIALAEEIGLITPLGDWVLRQACRAAMAWPGDIGVAVNVSPRQFEDAGRLIATIEAILAETGLPGSRLELEITESVLMRNEASVLATLHRLRDLGVGVAMDDFGTGYSSLSQLQSFPFSKIKIDRSFVAASGDTHTQDAVIGVIARLGRCLGMATIAEGIETTQQLERVRAGGCTSVQGYLFSRPVPQSGVPAVIESLGKTRPGALPLDPLGPSPRPLGIGAPIPKGLGLGPSGVQGQSPWPCLS